MVEQNEEYESSSSEDDGRSKYHPNPEKRGKEGPNFVFSVFHQNYKRFRKTVFPKMDLNALKEQFEQLDEDWAPAFFCKDDDAEEIDMIDSLWYSIMDYQKQKISDALLEIPEFVEFYDKMGVKGVILPSF